METTMTFTSRDIEIIRLRPTGPGVLGCVLPAGAGEDQMDADEFARAFIPPAGVRWGEGLLLDGHHLVSLDHLGGEPASIW